VESAQLSNIYETLFTPLKIGPVTAPNRFYQVPHCTGMGHLRPKADAATRAIKAEGGWGVVSTQETEIHPSSDLTPYPEQRIWDERDIPALRLVTDSVHEHGSLAAIELAHNGNHSINQLTRAPILGVNEMSADILSPRQARQMDKTDIKNLRYWHRLAARRAKEAGFDIVYAYAGHHMTLAHQFLLPNVNDRMDEYGGKLENRVRLIRELIEETKEEVGDQCAVAFRFAVDEVKGVDGMQAQEEGRAVVEMLAELPDLWDVNVSDWSNDSVTSRFEPNEGYQTSYIDFVKSVTSKPVVAVGRFTSPDHMAALVKKGVVDFIGAARPSIADPFLPMKIKEGRTEDIRECIGCNICVACDNLAIPIRCTQNPTMGEEWRRGWHPEKIQRKGDEETALVVGSGPAGLECAMQLERRGYKVTLAEANNEYGGRALSESKLKGLNAWRRVADYRVRYLQQTANVDLFLESKLSAENVIDLGIKNIFLATGSQWRSDGVGRSNRKIQSSQPANNVFTPDDIMAGTIPKTGPLVIYDDDQIYLGGVLAEHLSDSGLEIVFVTPSNNVSPWCENTLEQHRIQKSLINKNIDLKFGYIINEILEDTIQFECSFTGKKLTVPAQSVLLVTERSREISLYNDLVKLVSEKNSHDLFLKLVGDAASPGLIADAVFDGHLAARNFERDNGSVEKEFYIREIISLE
jgi:dimethylamine/trimethylamine dehydrogenase